MPSQLVYALDTDTGQAWWASTEDEPGAYTGRYVGGQGPCPSTSPTWPARRGVRPRRAADAARARGGETVSDTVVGENREITVRVTPQRTGVRLLAVELSVEGGTVVGGRRRGPAVAEAALGRTGCG